MFTLGFYSFEARQFPSGIAKLAYKEFQVPQPSVSKGGE